MNGYDYKTDHWEPNVTEVMTRTERQGSVSCVFMINAYLPTGIIRTTVELPFSKTISIGNGPEHDIDLDKKHIETASITIRCHYDGASLVVKTVRSPVKMRIHPEGAEKGHSFVDVREGEEIHVSSRTEFYLGVAQVVFSPSSKLIRRK